MRRSSLLFLASDAVAGFSSDPKLSEQLFRWKLKFEPFTHQPRRTLNIVSAGVVVHAGKAIGQSRFAYFPHNVLRITPKSV